MSTGVTSKQLNALHKMTNDEFAQVLLVLGSIALPAGTSASGFFARFAQTKVGGYITGYKAQSAIASFVGILFAKALETGLEADIVRESIIKFIVQHTGLQLETLDVEGAKKAAGKLLAEKVNEKYGTSFVNFYPPELMIEAVKLQIENEVIEALI